MEIGRFEIFVKEARAEFRSLISDYPDSRTGEMKEMIKKKISECNSDFEINVLKEHLQEEFSLYLDNLEGA